MRRRGAQQRIAELKNQEHELLQRLEVANMDYDAMQKKLENAKIIWAEKILKKKEAKAEQEQKLAEFRKNFELAQQKENTLKHTKLLEERAIQREQ